VDEHVDEQSAAGVGVERPGWGRERVADVGSQIGRGPDSALGDEPPGVEVIGVVAAVEPDLAGDAGAVIALSTRERSAPASSAIVSNGSS